MKKFNLSFPRNEIYELLADGMAFAGARGELGAPALERVVITSSDRKLLDGYFDEAVGRLLSRVRCFLTGTENSLARLELRFSMPDTFDENLVEGIGESLKGYLLSSLAWRWKETVLPEASQRARDFAMESLDEALTGLCHRRAPSRPARRRAALRSNP